MKYGNVLLITMTLVLLIGISALADPVSATNMLTIMSNIQSKIAQTISSSSGVSTRSSSIPEFPALGIPVATTIGLMLLFQHKKANQKK